MAERSVRLNQLEARVDIVRGDIREASRLFGKASFDVVTSNPPYMNDNHGLKNPDLPKAIARHEVFLSLIHISICLSSFRYPSRWQKSRIFL